MVRVLGVIVRLVRVGGDESRTTPTEGRCDTEGDLPRDDDVEMRGATGVEDRDGAAPRTLGPVEGETAREPAEGAGALALGAGELARGAGAPPRDAPPPPERIAGAPPPLPPADAPPPPPRPPGSAFTPNVKTVIASAAALNESRQFFLESCLNMTASNPSHECTWASAGQPLYYKTQTLSADSTKPAAQSIFVQNRSLPASFQPLDVTNLDDSTNLKSQMTTNGRNIVAINVGNTRTHVGRFESDGLKRSERFSNADLAKIVDFVTEQWKALDESAASGIVLASVNDPFAEKLTAALETALATDVYRVGPDIAVPVGQQLDPETMTGVDRLLNAAAAFDTVKQACIIVDAGTAVTVDFVDGHGTFHGGAIAPGASMQLHALHEDTAALPELAFRAPDPEPFGRNTAQAMYQGVFHGIRGMVQRLVEQYAESYGAFPMVIATGGDAQVLFENEELIDRIVPELTLMGIAAAARHALAEGSDDEQVRT